MITLTSGRPVFPDTATDAAVQQAETAGRRNLQQA
jgi:hypothetical protein